MFNLITTNVYYYFLQRIFQQGPVPPSPLKIAYDKQVGSLTSRQSGELLVDLKIFKILYRLHLWSLMEVECYYSFTNAFHSAFLDKFYCKVCFGGV